MCIEQAFRHLYVIATEKSLIEAIDCDIENKVKIKVKLYKRDSLEETFEIVNTPFLITRDCYVSQV